MFNLDPGKLLVIAVVAIILLGPDKLPQVARQAGNAWRSFNEFRHRMESEVRTTMPDLPPTSEIARLARSPSALLTHLSNLSEDERSDSADDEQSDASGEPPEATEVTADDGRVPPPAEDPAPSVTTTPRRVEPGPVSSGPAGEVVTGDPTLN